MYDVIGGVLLINIDMCVICDKSLVAIERPFFLITVESNSEEKKFQFT